MAEAAGSEVPQQELGWHRVCLNTIVRATKELDSARLRILPMGSRVNVVEVVGRRVKIDQPIDGWCSIESSNGDLILSKTSSEDNGGTGDDEGKDTYPPKTNFYKDRIEQTDKELQELENLRQQMADAKIKAEAVEKNEKEAQELNEKLQALQDQARDSENIQVQIEKKRRELENLQKSQEMEQKQTAVVDAKLYNLIGGESRDELPNKNNSKDTNLLYGDVVMLKDSQGLAIVRYVGEIEGEDEIMLGAELSCNTGDGCGTYKGNSYFKVEEDHALFVPLSGVKKKIPAEELLQKLNKIIFALSQSRSAVQ